MNRLPTFTRGQARPGHRARRADRVVMLCAGINPKTKFLEDVASNRGFAFGLLTDENEVKAWLSS